MTGGSSSTARSVLCLVFGAQLLGLGLVGCGRFVDLEPDTADERLLAPGESVSYRLELQEGDFVHLRVEQLGLDVELRWDEPAVQVDHDYGSWVPEELCTVAGSTGSYRLDVRALDKNPAPGRYRLSIVAWRPGGASERDAAEGCRRLFEAIENRDSDLQELDRVHDKFEQVDFLPFLRTLALAEVALAHGKTGSWLEARETWDEVVDVLRPQNLPAFLGRALDGRGRSLRRLERLTEARRDHREAIELLDAAGDRWGRATATANLAIVDQIEGRLAQACSRYEEARELFVETGDLQEEIRTRLLLARCLMDLGDMAQAHQHLVKVLDAVEAARDACWARDLEPKTLRELGWWQHLEGEPEKALDFLERSLELREDPAVLDRLGTVYRTLERFDDAHRVYLQALTAIPADDLLERAHVDANLCRLQTERGELEAAGERCHRALDVFSSLAAKGTEAHLLSVLASIEVQRGDLATAHDLATRAVAALEAQRGYLERGTEKGFFLAERIDSFQQLVDLRMALHERAPEQGWDRRALEAYGRMRARVLAEQLRERWTDAGEPPASVREVVDLELVGRMVDRDSRLLVYNLSPSGGHLWTFASGVWQSHRLSETHEWQPDLRRWLEMLRGRGGDCDAKCRSLAESLGSALLGPVARPLAELRLLIVADGELEQLPFAALTQGFRNRPERPLIADHEVVMLPSLEILQQIGRRGPDVATETLATLVYDPVHSDFDRRSRGFPASGRPFQRLERSEEEALALADLLGRERVELIGGFEAQRDRLLAGALRGSRIVHFATHAVAGTGPDERTGILLSEYFADGSAVEDPWIGLGDLYGNRLGLIAEMVVLSACETALGETLRGEGSLSLARGFMVAGVPRVVMSLWEVPDGPTAQLMERFYRAMVRQGLAPPAALRRAQLEAWREQPASHHWAAFVLRGDWRALSLDQR